MFRAHIRRLRSRARAAQSRDARVALNAGSLNPEASIRETGPGRLDPIGWARNMRRHRMQASQELASPLPADDGAADCADPGAAQFSQGGRIRSHSAQKTR
jgi:hypothetical protein